MSIKFLPIEDAEGPHPGPLPGGEGEGEGVFPGGEGEGERVLPGAEGGWKAELVEVALEGLRGPAGARPIDKAAVAMLAGSMALNGLLSPITVRRVEGGHEVVAGMHRRAAAERLGWATIRAFVLDVDGLTAELVRIDENLCRNELSPAERAAATARRKAIYEQLHPETRHGGDRRSSRQVGDLKETERFSAETSAATGHSERQVQREAARGSAIGAEALARVARTSLDKGEELDALSKLEPGRRDQVIARVAAGERVSAKAELKKAARETREAALAGRQRALPAKKYGVIYADPEWRFEPRSRETGMDRAADNHYPTSETDDIVLRPVGAIAAADAVLFLWGTAPMLKSAIRVLEGWGFTYVTHLIWHKLRPGAARGPGYWFTGEHELLLIGRRGAIPAPAPGTQWPSVIAEPVGKHSAKPSVFYDLIEEYYPNLLKIELNARAARPGWDRWGLEAPEEHVSPQAASREGEVSQEGPHPGPLPGGEGEGEAGDV